MNIVTESKWSGFYKLPIEKRREIACDELGLNQDEKELLKKEGPIPFDVLDKMSENVIGSVQLPLSVAPNFLIDSKEVVVPMAIEEASVVAACSYGAKLASKNGGFTTTYTGSLMIGQIQIVNMKNPQMAKQKIDEMSTELVKIADIHATHLHPFGGGVKECSSRLISTDRGKMLIVEYVINVCDAMGANAVNTVLEKVAPHVEKTCEGESRLKILTNLATRRMVGARAVWSKDDVGAESGIEAILDCWSMAMCDPYRRSTHNKGIMNGIDAVLVACGNDWRAVEAGAHSYSAMKQGALTTFRKTQDGDLEGKILLPMAVGTIGGSLRVNPIAKMCIKMMGVRSAGDFAKVLACVGLSQNFAALRALALEGIQKGHMRLHARNLAMSAGANENEIDKVVKIMDELKEVSDVSAKKALTILRDK